MCNDKSINFLDHDRELNAHRNKASVSLFSNTLFILKTLFFVEGEYPQDTERIVQQ